MKKLIITITTFLLAGVCANAETFVWIEGESAIETNLKGDPSDSWLHGDNPKLLSGGDMFAHVNYAKTPLPEPAYILWKFDAPEAGEYQVYFRHGYIGHLGQMRYRFVQLGADGAPLKKPAPEEGWNPFDLDAKVMDRQTIGKDRTIEWTRQSPVTLKKGSYYLDLQVTGVGPEHVTDLLVWTVIDCICLSKEPFAPSGATKPGETPATPVGGKGGADYY